MENRAQSRCTAFEGFRRIASGDLVEVARKAKEVIDRGEHRPVLIFDDTTSEPIDIDFRGTIQNVLGRLQQPTSQDPSPSGLAPRDPEVPRGPGRPKLGVVPREVTLLPRHWDWLNSQPGGASVALRKLVEEARRVHAGRDRVRQSQEAAYRFMSSIAGDFAGFEEAARALFAGNRERFDQQIESWPADIREHAQNLAAVALQGTVDNSSREHRSCSQAFAD